jgi:uncharacterized protein DUF4253
LAAVPWDLSRGAVARAIGVAAVVGLVLWGTDVANRGDDAGAAAEQSRLCQSVRRAATTLPAGASRAAEAACGNGFHRVPTTTRAAVSERGCDRPSDDQVTSVSRLTAAAPAQRVAFFAPRVGSLPRSGTATVGGVALPRGSRCPHYWATDAPTTGAVALARRLARVFPQTGLWPVLWDWEESPDHYARSSGDPRRADRVEVEAALRSVWKTYRSDGASFGGLAAGGTPPAREPDPYAQLAASGDLESSTGQVLLLVPVHRPADAIAMLGFIQSEVASDAALTAVARSWEERFGAFVVSIGPGELGVSVSAPPTAANQARALAAEQSAFAPEGDDESLDVVAAALPHRDYWTFGWPD